MTGRRPLRFILFAFEIPRIALVYVAVSGFPGSSGSSYAAAFATPQSLFLMMALFAWFDSDRYDAYRPLFAVGKLISAVTLGVWSIGSVQGLVGTASINELHSIIALAAAAAISVYDLLSGLLVSISVIRTRVSVESAGELPALVVDEVGDLVDDEAGGS